jgi:hypothetical protein
LYNPFTEYKKNLEELQKCNSKIKVLCDELYEYKLGSLAHELGHCIISKFFENKVYKVNISLSGSYITNVINVYKKENTIYFTKNHYNNSLIFLGGLLNYFYYPKEVLGLDSDIKKIVENYKDIVKNGNIKFINLFNYCTDQNINEKVTEEIMLKIKESYSNYISLEFPNEYDMKSFYNYLHLAVKNVLRIFAKNEEQIDKLMNIFVQYISYNRNEENEFNEDHHLVNLINSMTLEGIY